METLPLETLRCILSFCGLRAQVTLRRVSKQFWALSDGVPKKWINLSDLFKPDMVDLSVRMAIAVRYAGAGLVGFSDFTGNGHNNDKHLQGLSLVLSISGPNLKILRLPQSQSMENVMHDFCKYAASFPKLEEITAVSIPPKLVVALPALRRINAFVGEQFGDEVDVEALAWKLSGCQHISGIDISLVHSITNHFGEKEVILCPEIRGLGGDLLNYFNDTYQQGCVVDCVARMFPEVCFTNVAVHSEDFARCLSPIAHRIKSAKLWFATENWTFKEAPVALSNMVCLEELIINIIAAEGLAQEYRDFFSFLSKLEHLENLRFAMKDRFIGWSCLLGMLAPSAPLKVLSIACESFPDDFHTHFKALAASGVQLSILCINQVKDDLIGVSFLRPIFDTMPCIETVILWDCEVDVFQFVSRTLANLTGLSIEPLKLDQILDFAEERIKSGKVLPKLNVKFAKASRIGLAQIERLRLAGMELVI